MRRALLTVPVLASLLLAVPDASSSEPASGSLGHDAPTVEWTGSVTLQTAGFSGVGCQQAIPDPTCDTFALTIGELAGFVEDEEGEQVPLPDDVLVGIATPDIEPGTIAEFDVYVYGPDGAELGRGTELGSNDTVTLREPAPGTYTVAVQSPLSTNPASEYRGRAQIVDAGPAGEAPPVDIESQCGMESAPAVRDADAALGIGAVGVAGDPTAATEGIDRSEPIVLDVLVYLDGITEERARAIFEHAAAESYAPLGIELRLAEVRTHSFETDDGLAIIRQTKALVGGARPDGIDIVEALVGYDIQQLNQYAIAGIADCIGGVAHDDRAFLVAEGNTPTDIAIGPVVFDYAANAHVTAHEIGHLLGGQHHYANCVEGIDASDVHEDHVEGSPCTLMFNAADLLGGDFDTLNGAIVRGSVSRHARP